MSIQQNPVRGPHGPRIDLLEFARQRDALGGTVAPGEMPRLADLLIDNEGRLDWRLAGERRLRADGGAESGLALSLRGVVNLRCMRCLQALGVTIAEERRFRIALTEAQAERFDAESDEFDALVADAHFDVLALIEDEAILALPIAPLHADCSLPVPRSPESTGLSDRPNPFLALRALKRSGDRGDDTPADAGSGDGA